MSGNLVPFEFKAHDAYKKLTCLGIHGDKCSKSVAILIVLECKCDDCTSVFVTCIDHSPVVLENQAACRHCSGIKFCDLCNSLYEILFIYDYIKKEIIPVCEDLNYEFAMQWMSTDPGGYERLGGKEK